MDMMMKMKMKKVGSVFTSADIELIVHATESLDKVIDALSSTLGIRSSTLTREMLTGHHGNGIILLKGSVVGDDARNLAERLMGSLSSEDLLRIYKDFDLYTDNRSSFYVRISKQEMVKGRIRLSQSDAVRIRLKIARQMHKASLEEFRSALVGSDEV
ncbi:MAG: RNA-binding domain-containing protein [Candidatus Nitrosocaldus sp.]